MIWIFFIVSSKFSNQDFCQIKYKFIRDLNNVLNIHIPILDTYKIIKLYFGFFS